MSVPAYILFGMLSTGILAGCFPGGGFLKQNPQGDSEIALTATVNPDSGAYAAIVKANSGVSQVLSVSDSQDVNGTSVVFPPGSLRIDTTISIEAGAPVAVMSSAAELGIGDAIAISGKSVAIQSSADADALVPFVLSIELPDASELMLNDIYEKLVVMYKVRVAALDKTVVGAIPRNEIKLNGRFVSISARHFGVYQTAYLKTPLTEKIEVASESPIFTQHSSRKLPALKILSRNPLVAKVGQTVEVSGENFRSGMIVTLAGTKAQNVQVMSDSKASFVVPAGPAFGLRNVSLEQDGIVHTVTLMFAGEPGDYPIITLPEADVCAEQKYYDAAGLLKTGLRVCSNPDLSGLKPENIAAGVTIAGVTGTLTAPVAISCSADGAVNCLANSEYKAVSIAGLAPKIAAGQIVAGVTGTASTETHSNCASDGATGCVATATYTAALTTGLAAKVLSGSTAAGIAGTALAESHSNCSSNGGQGCVVSGAYYAATSCSANGSNCYIPTYALTTQPLKAISYDAIDAGKSSIRSALSLGGVTGTLADCNANGTTGCVTTAVYQSADLTNLATGNIKRGVSIAGMTGDFPSAASPLPRYTDSGGTTNTAGSEITDLTLFITQLTVDGSFEFWDSSGIRRTGSGDSDIVASNVKSGTTFENFAITGTYAGGSNCTGDGQLGCLTTATFKSVDTSTLTQWDVRQGKTVGGINGSLGFYKNMANTTLFDRTIGAGAVTGLDVYDTIDDYNNNGTFPSLNPGGWSLASNVNWSTIVTNVAYKDEFTGLVWLKDDGTSYTWDNAITQCENSTNGSRTDWRLPTQKELMQAYNNAIWAQKATLYLNQSSYYWSASSSSGLTGSAWAVYLANGQTQAEVKSNSYRVTCVAP